MRDQTILDHITALIDEERRLRDAPQAAANEAERVRHIEEQLDQCWDLLRQRRAQREFGADPSKASVRDVRTVEGYEG